MKSIIMQTVLPCFLTHIQYWWNVFYHAKKLLVLFDTFLTKPRMYCKCLIIFQALRQSDADRKYMSAENISTLYKYFIATSQIIVAGNGIQKETSTQMYTPFYIGFNLQYGPYAYFGY